jgi:hypothetical protein
MCRLGLAFDIETTGLNMHKDVITCISLYGPGMDVDRTYIRPKGVWDPGEIFTHFDRCGVLYAYNGSRFDLKFIGKSFAVPRDRMTAWRLKLVDLYEACRLGLGITFNLNSALIVNGLSGKSGNGREAIQLYNEGNHESLMAYCRDDAILTYQLCGLQKLRIPNASVMFAVNDGLFYDNSNCI